MTDSLEFHVSWLERRHGTTAEKATFGELEINVGQLSLTELEDRAARTVRTCARVSILHLARWLASNWWRLRWEPEAAGVDWRMSHHLAAAGGGFLWPPISFSTDGEHVAVRSVAQLGNPNSPVRYLRTAEALVSASAFENGVDGLLSCVVERLVACGLDDEVRSLWEAVGNERNDAGVQQLRRREALLGLDAETVSAEILERLYENSSWMGDAALDEVLAAGRFDESEGCIALLKSWSTDSNVILDLDGFVQIGRRHRKGAVNGWQPWERGVDFARAVRDDLGLGLEPVASERLHELVGTDVAATTFPRSDGRLAAGFVSSGGIDSVGVVLRGRHPTSRRFDAARIIGDAAYHADSDRVLPVTDRGTARQKFQRAFAQEFLCPIDAVREMIKSSAPSVSELEDVAERFQVSEYLVRTALVNRGVASRDYLPT